MFDITVKIGEDTYTSRKIENESLDVMLIMVKDIMGKRGWFQIETVNGNFLIFGPDLMQKAIVEITPNVEEVI